MGHVILPSKLGLLKTMHEEENDDTPTFSLKHFFSEEKNKQTD